jgi:hypothetical protein
MTSGQARTFVRRPVRRQLAIFAAPIRLDRAMRVGNPRAMNEDKPDAVEVWGRRIGRALGALAAIGLLAYLLATYLPA